MKNRKLLVGVVVIFLCVVNISMLIYNSVYAKKIAVANKASATFKHTPLKTMSFGKSVLNTINMMKRMSF